MHYYVREKVEVCSREIPVTFLEQSIRHSYVLSMFVHLYFFEGNFNRKCIYAMYISSLAKHKSDMQKKNRQKKQPYTVLQRKPFLSGLRKAAIEKAIFNHHHHHHLQTDIRYCKSL